MIFDLSKLPDNFKLEVSKGDLIAFAKEFINSNKTTVVESKEQDDILTFEEMCSLLNIAKPTGYTKTSKGEIPHFKRGGKLYFKKSELITWIEEGRKKTSKDIDQLADDYLKKNQSL